MSKKVRFVALCLSLGLLYSFSYGQDFDLDDEPDHSIEGNTYINETFQFSVSVFNQYWKITTQFEELGDGVSVAEFDESDYGAWGLLAISKYSQPDLRAFAKKGEYNAKKAKYTFIAGKKAFAASKKMERGGFDISSQVYKFVHNNVGYIFSFSYLSQWDEDDILQAQIDEILNSFIFSDEQKVVQQMLKEKKSKKEKLTNVAMLDMIDLKNGKADEETQVLTNEIQNQLNKTGQFEFIERRNMNKIIEEHKFQLTGMISDDSAIKVGELVGANYVLNSNIGILGKTSVLYVQITDAESGKIISSASIRVSNADKEDLLDKIPLLVSKLLYE